MQKEVIIKCGLMAALICGLMATTGHAQVHINVNIGPPAPVVIAAPPPMLFLPEPAVYVAVGTPYDIFFIGGRYYYLYGDNWFWGPGYDGPWTFVTYRTLPPGLRKYKVVQLRDYREREYKVYRVQGAKFKGNHFYAIASPGQNGNSQGNGNGKHKGNKH